MGFFSWNCPCCGHSIRHKSATNETSAWLTETTIVFPSGDRVSGTYDGYGRVFSKVVETELDSGADFTMYHTACWKITGKPEYTKPSEPARDQGHFVGDYDPPEPKTPVDCRVLLDAINAMAERERQEAKVWRQAKIAELQAKGEPVPPWLKD